MFNLGGYILRSGIARSCGNSYFNFFFEEAPNFTIEAEPPDSPITSLRVPISP